MLSRSGVFVGLCSLAAAACVAGCVQRGMEPLVEPPMVFLDGKPVSFYITGQDSQADEANRKVATRESVIERIKATSPGAPFGRGEHKKLKPFKYIYREVQPGAVSTEKELVAIANEIAASLERDGTAHGRPFVLIQESLSGWLFREVVRVAVPVQDAVPAPANLLADTFGGAMVAIQKDKATGEQGNLDAMERWAESTITAVTGKEPESSGPFLMRIVDLDVPAEDPVLWDWIVPIGPLPEPAPEPAEATAPAAAPAQPGAAVSTGGN